MNYSKIEGCYIDTLIEDYMELSNGDICTFEFFVENEEMLRDMNLIMEVSREWLDSDLTSFDMEE